MTSVDIIKAQNNAGLHGGSGTAQCVVQEGSAG